MKIDRPTVPEVIPLVQAYYALPGNDLGGSLHIVLEDGNVENRHVEFCREWAIKEGDTAGVELADVLLKMTKTQRSKLARCWR